MTGEVVLEAQGLERHYEIGGGLFKKPGLVKAVAGASFTLSAGKTLAVVGESGCGKSTLARLVTMIEPPSAGKLTIDGIDVTEARDREKAKRLRETVQIVFQDPYGSLNLRQRVGTILEEPLVINRPEMSAEERREAGRAMMEKVGLRPEHYVRYPHMFSGGQRQRIAIARALILNPAFVVADEPTSMLDVSIRTSIMKLMQDLADRLGVTYLYITHDLAVARYMSSRLAVMYQGKIVEIGDTEEVLHHPQHEYTRRLLAAVPIPDPRAKRLAVAPR